MPLINIDAPAAAKMLADEAAAKLAPLLKDAVTQLVTELKTALVGRTITIKID